MKKSKLFTIITLAIAILTTTLTPVTSATAQAATKCPFKDYTGISYEETYSSSNYTDKSLSIYFKVGEKGTLKVYKGSWKKNKYGVWSSYNTKISQKNYKKYKVTFKSSNKKVATVSSKGVVTAKGGGKCTITVSSKYGKAKMYFTVDDTNVVLLKIMKEQIGPNVEQLSDFEKVHVVMLWINGNIDFKRTFGEEDDSKTTISRGYGMCHDMAILLRDMCEALGMEAEYYLNKEINPNHAWNRVKVDGKWWEVDPSNGILPHIKGGVEKTETNPTGRLQHPIVQAWDAKLAELGDCEIRNVNGEPKRFYNGVQEKDIPGTHKYYLEELKVKVGHDKVDHTKYQDLFVWENANWY
ncbi:transglutaminase domain-containing protein [Acetivibrio ethanolgignens]|uniref:Transglutaminase-like domain-containing protein n=1 Tax=Acetivibrio ethanolgignens TaxID=290052 RepID=A0A0V8QHT4_9FIRM|nr:transglutaminase domain-containing protein [Acetivibrio ethanolgignens]KSV60129.1 hypothetical protein ASU35_17435 [Acetivibrio ethanolgignens]